MLKRKKNLISLIITCYNESANIENLYTRVLEVFRTLPEYDVEFLYVDNVSTDGSQEIYKRLARKDKRVKVIFMSRNTGSPQQSFIAGMSYAQGDGTILVHGDIQDPPELFPKFLQKWEEGWDVVYGVRTHRVGHGVLWNFYYKAFYYLLHKMAYIPVPLHAGEFGVMSRRVVDALLAIPEFDYNVRCLRSLVGFSQVGLPYVRSPRGGGKSTVNFLSALISAEEMIVNFSFKPLWFIVICGIVTFVLAGSLAVFDFIWTLIYRTGFPGISLGSILILSVLGLLFLSLAIIAMYIAKIFLEVKGRPRFIIQETINLPKGLTDAMKIRTILNHHHDYQLLRSGIQNI